jgi:4-hydroxyproline epimerase
MSATIRVIESHTGGEPTRVVIAGGPDLAAGTMAGKSAELRARHDWLRSAVCNEPRGHDAMVGALICEPHEPDCVCGVIYFNNVSSHNMCIHGTIGLAVTLAHLGKIGPGPHRIDTPVGVVTATLHHDGSVTVANVPSYRKGAATVHVPGWGEVRGEIAWGGNWFFLIDRQGPAVEFANIESLTAFTRAVRNALIEDNITGDHDMEIDHIEVFGPPADPSLADSKNFVLCPGAAYDRSPCGTGTSAKLACLHAGGKLAPGQLWRQAGIHDTVFQGSVAEAGAGNVIPSVTGRAWVNGESTYILNPTDPFQFGIPIPS